MLQWPRTCVATVTSDAYAVGTAVLLGSLAAQNPTLDATFVVLHDRLSAGISRRLRAIPGVKLIRVGDALRARLDTICRRHPALARLEARFHALEAFALREFERVLFLDSDVLCVGKLGNLLSRSKGLHVCPDRTLRSGLLRDAESFLPVRVDEGRPGLTIRAFNTGVMLIGSDLLTGETHDVLLTALEEMDWSRVHSGHTDQYVLNHAFRERWQSLPGRYNRFVPPQSAMAPAGAGEGIAEAVFLHFIGRAKPWAGRAGPDWRRSEGARRAALREWDRVRLRWALGCTRNADLLPLYDIGQREALRLAARILPTTALRKQGRQPPNNRR